MVMFDLATMIKFSFFCLILQKKTKTNNQTTKKKNIYKHNKKTRNNRFVDTVILAHCGNRTHDRTIIVCSTIELSGNQKKKTNKPKHKNTN